jgi:hypothetical protein
MTSDAFTFEGKPATSYIEAVLFWLVNSKSDFCHAKDIGNPQWKKGTVLSNRQIQVSLSNFHRLGIIARIEPGNYKLDHKALCTFAVQCLAKKATIWYAGAGKADSPAQSKRQSEKARIITAILAAYEKPLTLKNIVAISQNIGRPIPPTYASYYRVNHPAWLQVQPGKIGNANCFLATERLFTDNADIADQLLALLPTDRGRVLLRRFNQYAPEMVAKLCGEQNAVIQAEPSALTDAPEPQKAFEPRPIDLLRAILAGYEEPMNRKAILAKAIDNGYSNLTEGFFRWYQYHHREELTRKFAEKNRRGGYLNNANDLFFTKNKHLAHVFAQILPDRAQIIFKRFGVAVGTGSQQAPGTGAPDKTLGDQQQGAPGYPPTVATPLQECCEAAPAEDEHDQELETVDAWKVGASILAYTQKLRADLKALQSEDFQSEQVKDLHHKLDNLTSSLVAAKSERNHYETENKKLQKIIEEKDRRLEVKTARIYELEKKLEVRGVPVSVSHFKMNEVARITRVIKGQNPIKSTGTDGAKR